MRTKIDKSIVWFIFLLPFLGFSQESANDKKTVFSIHLIESLRFEESGFSQKSSEWSKPGIEGQLVKYFSQNIGLQFRLGYVRWSNQRESVFPLLLGPEFQLVSSDQLRLAFYLNVGTSAVVGNDYAGFFAGAESGLQLTSMSKGGFVVGVGWNGHFMFHPSEFHSLKLYVGWRF